MIDITKKYRTSDGREAVLLCKNAPGTFPIIGYVISDGESIPVAWNPVGQSIGPPAYTLYEVRPSPEAVVRGAFNGQFEIGPSTVGTVIRRIVRDLRAHGYLREDGDD